MSSFESGSDEDFELVTLRSGVISLRALSNRETFHPVTGPEIEAKILHVDQQRLLERSSLSDKFVVWDVGLGAGANALAAIRALENSKNNVEIHSFDQTKKPLEFALKNSESLGYFHGRESMIHLLLQEGSVQISPSVRWYFHSGDFRLTALLPTLPSPHAILYDPYSRTHNPEMWTLEAFSELFSRIDSRETCLWTNYTRSTSIRVALLLAGFFVGVGEGVGLKSQTTIASNRLESLKKPLDLRWLERVKASRNSAPLRDAYRNEPGVREIEPVDFDRLAALPQFETVL